MLLHNQTRNELTWEGAGLAFRWSPYGASEIPDELVPFLRAQKFPVDVHPVTPEYKASVAVEQGREAARADEVVKLKAELEVAQAAVASAGKATEESEVRRGEVERELTEARRLLSEQTARAERAEADKGAAEKLLNELGNKVEQLAPSQPETPAKDSQKKK